jgi:hypothetical protein
VRKVKQAQLQAQVQVHALNSCKTAWIRRYVTMVRDIQLFEQRGDDERIARLCQLSGCYRALVQLLRARKAREFIGLLRGAPQLQQRRHRCIRRRINTSVCALHPCASGRKHRRRWLAAARKARRGSLQTPREGGRHAGNMRAQV